MATESVNVMITAEDKASAEFRKTQAAINETVSSVKTAGQSIKATTGVTQQLANALGSSGLGAVASQIGGITSQVSALSQSLKAGAIGAAAFGVGISAIAITIGVQIGKAMANWILQLDEINERSTKAIENLQKMTNEIISARQKQYARADSPEERAALAEKAGQRQIELMRKEKIVLAELEEQKAAGFLGIGSYTQEALDAKQAEIDGIQAQIEAEKDLMTAHRERVADDEKQAQRDAEKAAQEKHEAAHAAEQKKHLDEIEAKEERNAARKKAREEHHKQQQKELWDMAANAQKKMEEWEANRAKAAKEREAEQKRIADIKTSSIDQMKEEIIRLKEGDEAARSFALQKQGLSVADADQLAAAEAQIAALKSGQTKTTAQGPNTAVESRFASGRVEMDHAKVSAENSKRQVKLAEENLKQLEKALATLAAIETNTATGGVQEAR